MSVFSDILMWLHMIYTLIQCLFTTMQWEEEENEESSAQITHAFARSPWPYSEREREKKRERGGGGRFCLRILKF